MTGEKVATVRPQKTPGCFASTTRVEFRKDPDGSGFEWRTNDTFLCGKSTFIRFKVGEDTKEFYGHNPGDDVWKTCHYIKHIKEGSVMQIESWAGGGDGCFFSLSGSTKALNQL